MKTLRHTIALGLLLLAHTPSGWSSTKGPIAWQDWSPALFEQAAAENKFVILDLEAVWCHWCHVMDAKTYTDPQVSRIIEQHYIPVKVDHDARPDLANRYRDYGWPATIIFAPDGSEIIKRAGYIRPDRMAALLEAITRDTSKNCHKGGLGYDVPEYRTQGGTARASSV